MAKLQELDIPRPKGARHDRFKPFSFRVWVLDDVDKHVLLEVIGPRGARHCGTFVTRAQARSLAAMLTLAGRDGLTGKDEDR